ncbi:MAG: DNA/RNA nuclease SfsA [Alphaproteobacteria bacterium]
MTFEPSLVPARLRRRYKRFFADMTLDDGREVVAHCPNPGAMLGLLNEGARCWLSPSTNPKRKLAWTWELVDADGGLVGLNTGRPNALVADAIRDGTMPELAGYGELRREVKYGKNSRIDILLREPGRPDCYVEVKNVHLRREAGLAEFPDSVTARGAKHLAELADMVTAGHRAVMCFLIQRADCDRLALAGDIDPAYARAFAAATAAGVETVAYGCHITHEAIAVDRRMSFAG